MKTVNGDEAFYYKYKDGKLEGMILSHVDDFNMAGTEEFIEKIRSMLKAKLLVSKVEKNKFRLPELILRRQKLGLQFQWKITPKV